MTIQYTPVHRTNSMTQLNTDIGASAQFQIYSGTAPAAAGVTATGTLLVTYTGNAGGFGTATQSLAGVAITGTAGQFSCTAPTNPLVLNQAIVITGTFGGTGSITGYASPTTYYIIATNGSTTFSLSTSSGGAGVVTTAGAPTGLTYTQNTGILTASAIANATAVAAGTAGYYRINTTGAAPVTQGLVFQSVPLTTNALTAANGNVLNFASTTGVAVGMTASGTGVVSGSTVVAFTSTTVTLNLTSTAGVASAAAITFGGDVVLGNTVIANGQTCTFTSFTTTATGA